MKARLVLIGLLLGVFAAVIAWMAARASDQNRRIADLEARLKSSETRVVTPPPPVSQPLEPVHQEAPSPRQAPVAPPAPAPNSAEIDQLRTQLLDAQTSVARLQARVEELDHRALEALADRARISTAETAQRSQVEELTRRLEAFAAERPAQEKRLRELEMDNARLREQVASAAHRGGQVGRLANEWQDLAQRQQVYLTNAMRRFRELTDLLRRMPGNLEMKGNGPEMTRVQSVISMADEDLRQLNDLTVRLGRVHKQLLTLQ